jgi:hypothetical protein
MVPRDDWSIAEVEAAVDDYLHMLKLDLAGQAYNKSIHRRNLRVKLADRSEASIELKHRNISAVLLKFGCPYISGYRPLPHYQGLLQDVVADRLDRDGLFDKAALSAVELPAAPLVPSTFEGVLTTAPTICKIEEPKLPEYFEPRTAGVHRDYLAREARNRSLGLAGEEFVVAYERHRLWSDGRKALSERVEHVSKTKGDGLGYDVLSFDGDGRDRFLEVKTTSFGRETPFYVSRSELSFSDKFSDQFGLCRVFEFRRKPRMFELRGSIQGQVLLDPVSYLARFN